MAILDIVVLLCMFGIFVLSCVHCYFSGKQKGYIDGHNIKHTSRYNEGYDDGSNGRDRAIFF